MDLGDLEAEAGLTDKQLEGLQLLSGDASRVLLYGGARSGKTFLICVAIVYIALQFAGSRHLIARLRYAHARNSLWLDTVISALQYWGVEYVVSWKESDHFVEFPNGSEIWVDGLDDKERVDKILGREYATIYLNEVSQIAWPTVTTVLTRLAQNVPGLKNRAYFDCNPPSKHHWSYKLFIQGEDPETGEKISNPEHYACLRLNPGDNADNLPDGYIEEVLEHLPEDKRRRFLLGEYGDSAGAIFTNWDIVEEIPEKVKSHSRHVAGLDFGFSVDPAALVDVYINGEDVYVDELVYDKNLTNQQLAERIRTVGLDSQTIEADSAEPKSIRELNTSGLRVRGVEKGADSVRAGVDWLRSKRLHITRRSVDLITELQEYVWSQDKDGNFEPKPIDDYNHAIDALRYAVDPVRRRTGQVSKISAGRLGL